jgi:inorganic pyrophosphatase
LRGGGEEKKSMKRVMSHEDINTETVGEEDTLETRYFAKDQVEGEHRSLWHDLPLFESDPNTGKPTGALNFVCEIPKWTRKKFELATKEALNPIKQDEKKGQLRSFKKGDIYFNYGCFPRTWEDPDYSHPDVKVGGDNDPLDVCEIGLRQIPTGKVRPVKVLGILCMIDEGEADWKVVVIDREDPWAEKLKDIDDVHKMIPGLLDAIREWFRTYKIPDGKPPNEFALGEQFMNRAYALGVIHETHRGATLVHLYVLK